MKRTRIDRRNRGGEKLVQENKKKAEFPEEARMKGASMRN